jgi:hypothetical protein
MKRWAREDPKAASAWLANLPESQNREAAVKNFVDNAADHEPQLAWTWALLLSDPQKQNDALEKAAKQWLRVDDKGARATIRASGLPDELVTKLLKPTD